MAALKFLVSFLLITIYLSPQVQPAALKNDTSSIIRNDFVQGAIQAGDRLLLSQLVHVQAEPGKVVTENVFFAGCLVRLNYISAYEIQSSAGATVELIAGGLDENIAFLTFTSAVGGELWYLVNMYGH